MRQEYNHTTVKTVLRQVKGTKKWKILVEASPVYTDDRLGPTSITEDPNITVTTPIFEDEPLRKRKDGSDVFRVKRNAAGVIMCKSTIDKAACIYADQIRKIRQDEYDKEILYSKDEKKLIAKFKAGEKDFVEYFDEAVERLHPNGSKGVLNNWRRTLRLFKEFTGKRKVSFNELDLKLCNDFKYYITSKTKEVNHNGKGLLARGTMAQYVSTFKAVLKQAFVEEYIQTDLSAQFKGVSVPKSCRETLDMKEINKLGRTKCDRPVVKRAALFTLLTGLRHVDVKSLKWGQIIHTGDGWRLEFTQQKTGVPAYLPISDQAYSLFGEPDSPNRLIFKGLPEVSECNRSIKKWLKAAKIKRHITYHCFRHSFATLLLQKGVDLFTIKTMLGHTRVTTTEIYSHIEDAMKRKAADAIDLSIKKEDKKNDE